MMTDTKATMHRRASWAQPSVSRDFALLSAAIIFVMLLISAWVAWMTYMAHSRATVGELAQEAARIERLLGIEFETTGHLLEGVGRQIVIVADGDEKTIAQILKSYDATNTRYAVWSWSNAEGNIIASSARGVLDVPVSVADRDYVIHSKMEPWKVHLGMPVEGRISNRWIIPIAIGVNDFTGKFLGTLEASIDVGALTDQISTLVKRDGISFSIISKTFVPLTTVAENEEFLVSQLPLNNLRQIDPSEPSEGVISRMYPFSRDGIFSYFRVSANYPYIIVVAYDGRISDNAVRSLLWPRLLAIIFVAAFLLLLLSIIRTRVIKPVVQLGNIAAEVASGGYKVPSKNGPLEIEVLAIQLGRIADYVMERKRVEEELRNKIGMLQQRLHRTQMEMRSRAVLLAGVLSEYKASLRNINGHAQVMKDQLYGPIENKKYRQYAADIHQAGTTLELMVRKLIALSRVDASSVLMRDEPVNLASVVEQARRFVVDALPEGASFTLKFDRGDSPDLCLQADGMHVQQGISYAMLYLTGTGAAEKGMECRLKRLVAVRDEERYVLLFGAAGLEEPPIAQVLEAIERAEKEPVEPDGEDAAGGQLHLMLADVLLASQQMALVAVRARESGTWLAVHIPARRILRQGESLL